MRWQLAVLVFDSGQKFVWSEGECERNDLPCPAELIVDFNRCNPLLVHRVRYYVTYQPIGT